MTSYEQLQAMMCAECKADFDCIVWSSEDLPEEYRTCREAQNARVLAGEDRWRGQAS